MTRSDIDALLARHQQAFASRSAVQIAAGGQDLRCAQQITPGGRAHEAAVECGDQRRQLVIVAKQPVRLYQGFEGRAMGIVRRHAGHDEDCVRRGAFHEGFDRRARYLQSVRCLGHRQQHVHAFRC